MQSKFNFDMGFDFSNDDDPPEVKKEDSSISSEQTITSSENQSSGTGEAPNQAENLDSSRENNPTPTQVTQEVDGIPVEDYFDTDYNKTEQELQTQFGETPSFYASDSSNSSTSSSSSNSSEKNGDPWAGAKLLLTPITFIANIISTPFNISKNTPPSTEQEKSIDEVPNPIFDVNFDGVDYEEHQKGVSSTNKIIGAMVDTVKGASQTNIEECKNHKFQYPEREKLHKKTGGTDNIEMVGVNVFLDKSGKPLLPGARKSLKQHANAKQESFKENNSEIHPPSEATSHALKEFEIAHEFGKGEDHYDKAGSLIHTGKGIVELSSLDLESLQGGVTSQPGFVTKSPSSAYLINKIRERSDKAQKKDNSTITSTTSSEELEKNSSDVSSQKKI
ncbi:hypothetical protein [Legionella sp. PC997]|uniref:hypothetical protein n=1 Tax=Legionella sp. PC997 TaxID=2755562 RepID=UPI0015FE6636|nr:hypothetical protein [Legionella sp. PC997]QMT60539.1 hypothetical protein HBNCFIEN_01912 [Legionella sp. PC997]